MAELLVDGSILRIETDRFTAELRTEGYVSGVAAGTFQDRATGARELGFGLDIVDFLLEPGWDDADGAEPVAHRYNRDREVHGDLPKRYVELPQICTQAKKLPHATFRGPGFVAVRQWFHWTEATYGRVPGSLWEQTLVFPDGKRYFYAADRVTSVNAVPNLFLRIDMPGHLRHRGGDTFEAVYLGYEGMIPASAFVQDFPPDARFLYQRGATPPERMIRAYRTQLPEGPGPWLAGMTLDPGIVSEAWCHQRGYVCFIQEIGGRAVAAGESFGAAYVIGYFDSIDEMNAVYDAHRGARGIAVEDGGYRLTD